jgi:hypothetical protein
MRENDVFEVKNEVCQEYVKIEDSSDLEEF